MKEVNRIAHLIRKNKSKVTWKDIVKIGDNIYAEEFPISGQMDAPDVYQIDDFFEAVAKKYNVDIDDIQTYMMNDIDFDVSKLPWGAESCGCYIDGIDEVAYLDNYCSDEKCERYKNLLYNALVYIEEMINGDIIGSDVEEAIGITVEEYDEIVAESFNDITGKNAELKEFIVSWCKEHDYFDANGTLSAHVDTDVAYDMKSDFEKSKLNQCKKDSVDYEVVFDDYYDEIVEEMQPILRRLKAIRED